MNHMDSSQFRLHGGDDGAWLVCVICQADLDGDGGLFDLAAAIKAAREHARHAHGLPLTFYQSKIVLDNR